MMLIAIVICIWVLLFMVLFGCFFYLRFISWEIPTPRLVYSTLWRDFRSAVRYLKTCIFILFHHRQNLESFFQKLVKRHPNKVCFLYEDKEWTYKQVEDFSNRVANAFAAAGYRKGDSVALFMENRPEYVCIWLGLSKIGVITALVNSSLKLHSLAHSINVINSKAVIFDAELASTVKDVIPMLGKNLIHYFCLDTMGNEDFKDDCVTSLEIFLQGASGDLLENKNKISIGSEDTLFYIYTSGTTGLPKAAVITHRRFTWVGVTMKYVIPLKDDDIIYNFLPLYHMSGGIINLSTVLIFGGTMVFTKKFSAANFWTDIVKYKATVFQYIGEICRYLLHQPKKIEETQHSIRVMIGNGLRPQLWEEFQKRFSIPQIFEMYGSTEGNVGIANIFGKVGAVGFIPLLVSRRFPINLIKVAENGEPVRKENGLCIRCKPGEPGEVVGKIVPHNPFHSFDGYADENATEKTIIRDCFKKGDAVFHSGDILVMDKDGYLYFVDRTGDTFRWRGENVSTAEVAAIITELFKLTTCAVYGVEIPGVEGKAGMAAIQSEETIDMDTLYRSLHNSLPTYAVPVFVRICKTLEITGTYKLKKTQLKEEGFDPVKISDPIFISSAKNDTYVRLDESHYNQIIKGETRL